ncbi:MAG: NUDIX domain-containing protein [Pseudonocardia sp.]
MSGDLQFDGLDGDPSVGADVLAAGAVLWRPAAGSSVVESGGIGSGGIGSGGVGTGTAAGAADFVGAVDAVDTVAKVELALVHRPRYDDWSFPKGKLDTEETMAAAAVREIGEETGFAVRLGHIVSDVRYVVPDGRKMVRYWSAQALDGHFTPGAETDELRWVGLDVAAELLTYPRDVDVLRRFTTVGIPESVVLLVRHAKAGNRLRWEGDDDLRPLSGAGHEQAEQLADLLPLFRPERLFSAPPLRCVDTFGPTASRLGMEVALEPLLGEDGYWDEPAAGLARLRELAAAGGVTAVCSQGGVIPDVVGELAEEAGARRLGIDPDDVPAKKGSTWVLGFRDGGLVTADHFPTPLG